MITHALAIAATSVTIGCTSIFKPLRENIPTRFLKKLLSCPYCLSHWLALGVALTYPWAGYFCFAINTMALVALSAIASICITHHLDQLDKR